MKKEKRNRLSMKVGDLVQFKPPYYISSVDNVYSLKVSDEPSLIGLLVECEKISRLMCTVFYDNRTLRIPIRDVKRIVKDIVR